MGKIDYRKQNRNWRKYRSRYNKETICGELLLFSLLKSLNIIQYGRLLWESLCRFYKIAWVRHKVGAKKCVMRIVGYINMNIVSRVFLSHLIKESVNDFDLLKMWNYIKTKPLRTVV